MRYIIAICLLIPLVAKAEASHFEGEISLTLMTQLDDADFRAKTGINAISLPSFAVLKAATFCEAIQVAKRELMNQVYQQPLSAMLCDEQKESSFEASGGDLKACFGQIEGGKLFSPEGKLLSTPELDITVDGVIVKEVTNSTWIQSCLIGRKWNPRRRADIGCDDVKCP